MVGGFDHPVYALFSPDDTKAYVLECGAECGGTTAAVTVLDLTTMTAGTRIPVPAATVGFLDGTTIFVVRGTPPGTSCSGTAATTCGELDGDLHPVVDGKRSLSPGQRWLPRPNGANR